MADFLSPPGPDPESAGVTVRQKLRRDYPNLTKQVNVTEGGRKLKFYLEGHPDNPTPGQHHMRLPTGKAAEGMDHHAVALQVEKEFPGVKIAKGVDPVSRETSGPPAPRRSVKRTRARADIVKADKATIAQRVIKFFTDDNQDRLFDIEARLQRYAKFRMWTEGKDWPWPGASDVGLSDIAAACLRLEDTLHNAAVQTRPIVNSKAFKPTDQAKQDKVDELLDFQFFVEAKGEVVIGKMARNFIVDGVVRVFIPWIKEKRSVHTIRQLQEIPADQDPGKYFALQMMQAYPPPYQIRNLDAAGWRWQVAKDGETFTVDFYTNKDGTVEMDAERIADVFDGPCPMVKDYEEICYPAGAENLQIPGPSNPRGSAHVVMVDYPTLDEVKRLVDSGYYDLVGDEDLEKLGMTPPDWTEGQAMREQKEIMAGKQRRNEPNVIPQNNPGKPSDPLVNDHKTLTRLMCFDIYDYDGDGKSEDVIWWVIKETKTVLRCRELTQQFPSNPPRRPFAEAAFLPENVSLIELMEGLHDISKQVIDQTIDTGTLTLMPWGLYRQTSSMRNEVIRMSPGELYGVSDPQRDINFPQMPQAGSNFGFNMLGMLNSLEERLVTQGDLQYGRVPQGKASALRTVRGMQSIMGQGDARPERLIRRWFFCLTEVYAQMHELNQAFLKKGKQYRVFGVGRPGDDPYRTLSDPAAEIQGRFTFDFIANAMNTSKEALQQAIGQIAQAFMAPIWLQLGIVQPDGAYNLGRDFIKSLGQDPDKYLSPPSPESNLPKLTAWDVINIIMAGQLPEGQPLEDSKTHMQTLMDFAGSPEFGLYTPEQVDLYKAYLQQLVRRVADEQRRAALVSAAGGQGGMPGQPGVPGPPPGPPAKQAPAQLGQNELADESLPGAGGGANPGAQPLQ